MDFSNFWWQAAEAPAPPTGIGNSLRFRGQQYLSRTFATHGDQKEWTWSCWLKLGCMPESVKGLAIFNPSTGTDNGNENFFGWPINSANLQAFERGGGGPGLTTSSLVRDPTAWYHVMLVLDSAANSWKIYLNGVEQPFTSLGTGQPANEALGWNMAKEHFIGRWIYTSDNWRRFEGYMADVYFIDGQALDPTEFGNYDANDVWTPKEYTGTYGANGFYLDFSDPADIGADRSGNGNDFTPTGFGTVLPVNYTFSKTTSALNSYPDAAAKENAPFVLPSSYVYLAGAVGTFTWEFNVAPIVAKSSIGIYWQGTAPYANNSLTITYKDNSTSTHAFDDPGTNATIPNLVSVNTTGGEIIKLELSNTAGAIGGFAGLEIDGSKLLFGGDGADYDVMQDSPTQNWATLNPLFNNGTLGPGTLSGANLNHAGITSYSTAPGTLSLKNGAYYFELTCGPAPGTTTFPAVGIIRNTNTAINSYVGYDTSGNVYGYGYDGYNGTFTGSTNGEGTTTATQIGSGGSSWMPGDVIGVRCDVPNNYLAWYHNNALVYEVTNLNSDYDWMPAASMYASPSTPNSINFGQRPFAYDIPAGYEALQTQNLPAAPIANGRDHFQAITDTGANILTAAQTAFPNGLWWLKQRDGGSDHRLVDSVRGASLMVRTPNTSAETAFTDPPGQCVAWCWNAGGSAVTNNDGSIQTQVAANTDAGFSIVTYTGNNTGGATIGHGLASAPEFLLFKNRDTGNNWIAWHKSLNGPTWNMYLNSYESQQNDGQLSAIGNSTVGLGATVSTNGSGNRLVAYCWHSVPAFSSIGSFQGNSSAEGPFIYTGFRPAFILCKRVDGGNSEWIIQDSTRSQNNPSSLSLFPSTSGEEIAGFNSIDFLSNGFKMRSDNQNTNAAGKYIYAALAEVPQGGNNIAPATAR